MVVAMPPLPDSRFGRHFFISLFAAIAVICSSVSGHAAAPVSGFVKAVGGRLTVDGKVMSGVGVNAYYLAQHCAYGDTAPVHEILSVLGHYRLGIIRTWGFFDGNDTTDPAVIQYHPQKYHEKALRELDRVLARARDAGVRLIIPFVNNWDDFGGMNQYVRWYAETHPAAKAGLHVQPLSQDVVGPHGRRYAVTAAQGYVHDDFYRINDIKSWYMQYVAMLLLRVNTINGVIYRDDPTVAVWELANEPRSSDATGEMVRSWVAEMSAYIKSIDTNHCVATGEEGFDVTGAGYSPVENYNNQTWMFDGTAGSSFKKNLLVAGIDLATSHLYPDAWNISAVSGDVWIADHTALAELAGKPCLIGEFGVQLNKPVVYTAWMNTIVDAGAVGGCVWQLVPSAWLLADPLAIEYPRDSAILSMFAASSAVLESGGKHGNGSPAGYVLAQNFPNPFNPGTTIRFSIPEAMHVRIILYDLLGRKIRTLVDEETTAGVHDIPVSADRLSGGVYYYRLAAGNYSAARAMVVVK
jgi:mannan endo-1,4-beta-mannosidase